MTFRILTLLNLMLILNFTHPVFADEGMWLPLFLKEYNYERMKELGCKLSPDQIYDINNASTKDAIVQFGNFCTAEVISDKGLLMTNYHCGFESILNSSDSTLNHVNNGFWAKSSSEEIPIPELTVTFLVRMEDVSSRILEKTNGIDLTKVEQVFRSEALKIIDEAQDESNYEASVVSMFGGTAYYLFVTETYKDIRLVASPPRSIGKFGGDTDNFMWPRHTGDFALFRIYSNENNKPAEFESNNKSFQPQHHLPISLKGTSPGAFSLIMGYPGSTKRYLTSSELESKIKYDQPLIIEILNDRLSSINKLISISNDGFKKYGTDQSRLNNSLKFYNGQLEGLKQNDIVGKLKAREAMNTTWFSVHNIPIDYKNSINKINSIYSNDPRMGINSICYNGAGFLPDMMTPAKSSYYLYLSKLGFLTSPTEAVIIKDLRKEGIELFDNFDSTLEAEKIKISLKYMENSTSLIARPVFFKEGTYSLRYNRSPAEFIEKIMKKSILANQQKFEKFIAFPTLGKLKRDPFFAYTLDLYDTHLIHVERKDKEKRQLLKPHRERYYSALRSKAEKGMPIYPDANSTCRITFGIVKPIEYSKDSSSSTFTYADEILEKYIPDDNEFDIPQDLLLTLKEKNYDAYTDSTGRLPVCFLTNTDITGGNSGSPVLNENGELVGLAFDHNWESTHSDIYWDEHLSRTISVDIRYILFIIDKIGHAQYLLDEMNIKNE